MVNWCSGVTARAALPNFGRYTSCVCQILIAAAKAANSESCQILKGAAAAANFRPCQISIAAAIWPAPKFYHA